MFGGGTEIIFVNGVNNDLDDVLASRKKLMKYFSPLSHKIDINLKVGFDYGFNEVQASLKIF